MTALIVGPGPDSLRVPEVIRSSDDLGTCAVSPGGSDWLHVPALKFCDSRVQTILSGIVLFAHNLRGFANRDLRESQENLLGKPTDSITPGRMSYDLRRLRHRGLIERIPKTHRYQLTSKSQRIALVFSRTYHRVLRPVIATVRTVR